jgi:hypothetical protein
MKMMKHRQLRNINSRGAKGGALPNVVVLLLVLCVVRIFCCDLELLIPRVFYEASWISAAEGTC